MKAYSPLLSITLVPFLIVWPVLADSVPAPATETLQVHVSALDGSTVASGSHSTQGFSVGVTDDNGVGVPDAAVLLRLPESGATGVFADGTHAAVAYTDGAGRAQFSNIQWASEPGTAAIEITATKGAAHAGTLLEQVIGSKAPLAQPPPSPAVETPSAALPTPAVVESAAAKPVSSVPQPGRLSHSEISPPDEPIHPHPHASQENPSVSIENSPTHEKFAPVSGSSHKKWYILAAVVAAGAGAGIAMMGKKSSSSSSSTSTSSVSIGTPTVSVGAP